MNNLDINKWARFLLIIASSLFIAKFFVSFVSAPKVLVFSLLLLLAMFFMKPVYILSIYSIFFWFPYFLGKRLLPTFMYGLSAAEGSMYLFFLLYLVIDIQRRKGYTGGFAKTPLLIPLIILFLSGLVAFNSNGVGDRELAIKLFRQVSVYAPIVYIIVTKMVRNAEEARKIILGIVIGGVVYGAFAYLMAQEYVGQAVSMVGRLGGEYLLGNIVFFFNADSIGTHLSTILPLSIILWLNKGRIIPRVFGILATILILFFLILTGTRTAWVASFFSISVLILLSWKYNKLKLSNIIFMIILFTAILSVIFIYELLSREVLERVESFRDRTAIESLDLRMVLWRGGLRYLWESPFGIGYSSQYPYCAMTSPHNFYILIGIGSGIFGLAAFLWFIIGCFRRIFRKLNSYSALDSEGPILIGAISSLSAFLFNCMTDMPTDANSISLLVTFMVLGLAVMFTKESSNPAPIN